MNETIKETWVVCVWSVDPDDSMLRYASADAKDCFVFSEPMDLPESHAGQCALSYAMEEGFIEYQGTDKLPDIGEGGIWVVADFEGYSHHYGGVDGDDYDFCYWLNGFRLATKTDLDGARRRARNFVARRQAWRKRVGCGRYDLTVGGKQFCHVTNYHGSSVSGPFVGDDGYLGPQCNRCKGQICFAHHDWHPLDSCEWVPPKNHFLDGTGVCRHAGKPYEKGFAGHEWDVSVQRLAESKGLETQDIQSAFDKAAQSAIAKGDLSFMFEYPKELVEYGSTYVYTKAKCRGQDCLHCSGLPMYESDCLYYDERPLCKGEFIVPCANGLYSTCSVRGRYIVLSVKDGPIHRGTTWQNQTEHWRDSDEWAQWYVGSNAYDSTTMWATFGIPVTGGPNNDPALGFDFHNVRRRWLRLTAIHKHLMELRNIDEARQRVGWIWQPVANEFESLYHDITLNADRNFDWRDILPESLLRWYRSNGFAQIERIERFNVNLPALARFLFYKRLLTQVREINTRSTAPNDRVLFDASVIDPWLRVAYGLEGQPENFWTGGIAFPEKRLDYDDPIRKDAGRLLTVDSQNRLRESWKTRYGWHF